MNLLIVGNDKIGRKLISELEDKSIESLDIILDKSSSLKRVYKLIKKGVIPLKLVFKMKIADLKRKDYKIDNYFSIKSNKSLLEILAKKKYENIYLFRAGLIINKHILELKIPILNIHCAKIPEYGGLGSIHKAIINEDYTQCATLHQVTRKIDEGRVLKEEPYLLDPNQNYFQNEEVAYMAGIKMLVNKLANISN